MATKSVEMPNLEYVVQDVRRSRAWDFTTEAGLCEYTNACVNALHETDPSFGHLTKTAGQNHCVDPQGRLHAKDVALYRPLGQIVDFVASAGHGNPPPTNAVVWMPGEVGEYAPDDWFEPVAGAPPTLPQPIAPGLDYTAMLTEIQATLNRDQETAARDTAMILARVDLTEQRILDRIEQVVENAEASGRKILALWLAQQAGQPPPPEGEVPPPDGAALLLLLLKALAERPAQG